MTLPLSYLVDGHIQFNERGIDYYVPVSSSKGNILSVGKGLRLSTIQSAIDEIASKAAAIDVTGTHNGVLAASAWGDLYTLSGHTVDFTTLGYNRQTFLEVNNDGIYRPVHAIPTATQLVTVAGRNSGSALASATYRLWQLPHYVIRLAPGRHEVGLLQFPNAVCISFIADGPETTRILCNNQMISGRNIRLGSSGIFEFSGIGFERADDVTCIAAHATTTTSGQCAILRLSNVNFYDLSPNDLVVAGGYCVTGFFAGVEFRNVNFSATGYQTLLNVDSLISQNTKMSYLFGTTPDADHQFHLMHSEYQRTKRWFIQNHVVDTYGTGAFADSWMLQIGTSGATVSKTKYVHVDGWSADQGEMNISGADLQVQLKNVDANVLTIGANAIVIASNVHKCNGSSLAPDHAVTGGATYTNVNNGLYTTQAYAASITPDANRAQIWNVGTLTGNMIVNAPTNPQNGQYLDFSFVQDATGGRTLTWNAIFHKAADGAGAANQMGMIRFRYNGAIPAWVQQGGTLTYFT